MSVKAQSRLSVLSVTAASILLASCTEGGRTYDPAAISSDRSASNRGSGVLTPTVTIGVEDGKEEYVFGFVNDAAIGEQGDIYIVDSHAKIVRQYGSDGRFIKNIGGQGAGPGEYSNPTMVAVGSDGRIVVGEARTGTVHIFSEEGEFDRRWALGIKLDGRLVAGDSGYVYVRPEGIRTEQYRWSTDFLQIDDKLNSFEVIRASAEDRGIWKVAPNGSIAQQIAAPRIPAQRGPYNSDPQGRLYYGIDFVPQVWWQFLPPKSMLVGDTGSDTIEIRSATLGGSGAASKSMGIIALSENRIKLASGERDLVQRQMNAALERCSTCEHHGSFEAPAWKPAYYRAVLGSDGRIWIRRHAEGERYYPQEGNAAYREVESVFDVFTGNGTFIARVTGPAGINPLAIDGNSVVSRTRLPSGAHAVTVYTVNFGPEATTE